MTYYLKDLFLPPGILLLAGLWGLILLKRRPALGRYVIASVGAALYILSLKATAYGLEGLEHHTPALDERAIAENESRGDIGAIVILGAGNYEAAPEYGGRDQPSGGSLIRLRYGARLARMTGKPILLSGGRPEGTDLSEAMTMNETLERDFLMNARWIEDRSRNTRESAKLAREILLAEGIEGIYLVTQESHMDRALGAFGRAGFKRMVPAPTDFLTKRRLRFKDFLPSGGGFAQTRHILHEWFGILYYRLAGAA